MIYVSGADAPTSDWLGLRCRCEHSPHEYKVMTHSHMTRKKPNATNNALAAALRNPNGLQKLQHASTILAPHADLLLAPWPYSNGTHHSLLLHGTTQAPRHLFTCVLGFLLHSWAPHAAHDAPLVRFGLGTCAFFSRGAQWMSGLCIDKSIKSGPQSGHSAHF